MTHPTSGHAEILGVTMPSRPILGRIGYMTQSDGIYPALTVGENARLLRARPTASASEAAVVDVARARRARRSTADAVAGTLSGGQRRRLSLACALIHRPPTSCSSTSRPSASTRSCASSSGRHFRALADQGTTIVVSSHVMDEADRCDELLFMRAGRIIARGTGGALRAEAGTDDLEAAFLHFAGETARRRAPVRRAPTRSARPRRLPSLRVIQEIRRDRPSLALLFVAPIVITGLVTFIVREGQTPVGLGGRRERGRRRRRRHGDARSNTALRRPG